MAVACPASVSAPDLESATYPEYWESQAFPEPQAFPEVLAIPEVLAHPAGKRAESVPEGDTEEALPVRASPAIPLESLQVRRP